MSIRGIIISDAKYENQIEVLLPNLHDIINEIKCGDRCTWSIQYLYATGDLGDGASLPQLEEEIRTSDKGLIISWVELLNLASKFWQVIDIVLVGLKDISAIHRFDDDRSMYENCDYAIKVIDGGFWEVFAKDSDLIDRLSQKFKNTKIINIDDVT